MDHRCRSSNSYGPSLRFGPSGCGFRGERTGPLPGQLPQLDWAADTTEANVQGFVGAFWPCSALGSPCGYWNEARDQYQRVPDEEHTLTGWLSVTVVAT